jgi:hypothetical protein
LPEQGSEKNGESHRSTQVKLEAFTYLSMKTGRGMVASLTEPVF